MALYAFDGTWNSDKPGSEHDTNVLLFSQAYTDRVFYRPGVGTRFGFLGHLVGGITGAGGRTRIDEAIEQLGQNVDAGDPVVDIVGFSRGAALAVHFANKVAEMPGALPIRFLGVWDCVPSFGVANIDVNVGWDLQLPDNVFKCYHALALDERRQNFHLHRLDARVEESNQEGRLFELWFRGVHSDVGGGNDNPGLSSIALNWMFRKAMTCGLPMDATKIDSNKPRMKPDAVCSEHKFDPVKNKYRVVRWNDQVHSSVSFRTDSNNPPIGLTVVDDEGARLAPFKQA